MTEQLSPQIENRRKRKKTAIACEACRSRKVRCNGALPVCSTCRNRREVHLCIYTSTSGIDDKSQRYIESLEERLRIYENASTNELERNTSNSSLARDAFKAPGLRNAGWTYNTSLQTPAALVAMSSPAHDHIEAISQHSSRILPIQETQIYRTPNSQHTNNEPIEPSYTGSSSSTSFMKFLRKSIQTRNGYDEQPGSPSALFRSTSIDSGFGGRPLDPSVDEDNLLLPPRRIADQLCDTYWKDHYPLYPVLHFERFRHQYEACWSGNSSDTDTHMTHTMLNLIFALSTESTRAQRGGQGNSRSMTYFTRARSLLRIGILSEWTFEMVQALVLCAQYLHSVSETHQCWALVGIAIRAAESLGLHIPSTSRQYQHKWEQELARRVWYSCVTLDRVVSMSLGRSPAISLPIASSVDLPSLTDDEGITSDGAPTRSSRDGSTLEPFVHSIGLFNVLHQILTALHSTDHRHPTEKKPLSVDVAKVTELEECLAEWEQSLPQHLKFDRHAKISQFTPVSMLDLRYLQVRILLYRPGLSAIVAKPTNTFTTSKSHPIRAALWLSCSKECVRAAQDMAACITTRIKNEPLDSQIFGWVIVNYIYTAATAILAAITSSVLTNEITRASLECSMNQCRFILEHYKERYESAAHCLAALSHIARDAGLELFNRPATVDVNQHDTGGGLVPEGSSPVDILQGLDLDNADFDATWLDSVPSDFYPSMHYQGII